MTAGSWIYIVTQGILQGTYETFAAMAEQHFGGTLEGTITVTAGLGGMSGAQPHSGMVIVATGTPEKAERLKRVLTADPDLGIFRHADAGYELAQDVARERRAKIPGLTK